MDTVTDLEQPHGADGDPSEGEGKYVYCVIRSPDEKDFGPIGIGEGVFLAACVASF